MAGGPEKRDKTIRARNWALFAVLLALAAVFYLVTIVRMTGG
jgi:hypothetical protein